MNVFCITTCLNSWTQAVWKRTIVPWDNTRITPKKIVSILIYSYSRGVFSSREIERRCNEDLSFMFIAEMNCPNFRVLSDFRKDNAEFFHNCFKQTVQLAMELKLASLGHISLD